ncbi:chemotaxis protein CheW [Cellvibrio sp.]|uniref:chemotaxis protein CheW n=1 Tax=Cellvibrio sp. TaxID=1965322 RepID=UPI003964892E
MNTQGQVEETPEAQLSAWILPISSSEVVAVGQYELKHIESVSSLVSLPGLPAFCEQGFVWRDRFIPALDLWSLVTRKRPVSAKEGLAAIIAYESTEGELAMGAILLSGVPKLLPVSASQSVAITELASHWQMLVQAAFKTDANVFPVLDLGRLFGKTPADLLSLH